MGAVPIAVARLRKGGKRFVCTGSPPRDMLTPLEFRQRSENLSLSVVRSSASGTVDTQVHPSGVRNSPPGKAIALKNVTSHYTSLRPW